MKVLSSLGLRGRLILMLLAAFGAMAGFLAWHLARDLDERIAAASAGLLHHAALIASRQTALAERADAILSGLMTSPELDRLRRTEDCDRFLVERQKLETNFDRMSTFEPNGDQACVSAPRPGRPSVAGRPFFERTLRARSMIIADVEIGASSGMPVILFGKARHDPGGAVTKVFVAVLKLDWLKNELAKIDLAPGARLTVLDGSGVVTLRFPDPGAWTGKSASQVPVYQRALASGGTGTLAETSSDGEPRLYAYTPLFSTASGSSYLLLLSIPKQVVEAPARREALFGVLAMLTILLGVMGGVFVGGHRLLLQPLLAMSRTVTRLKAGELSARSGLPHGDDEIGRLAESLDQTAAAIEDRELRLAHANRALRVLSAGNRAMLHSDRDEHKLTEEMCRAIVEAGGYRLAWVVYAQADRQVQVMATWGVEASWVENMHLTWDETAHGGDPAGTAIRTGEPAVCNDIATDPDYAPWREAAQQLGYAAALALPLQLHGEVIGALTLCDAQANAFSSDVIELLAESTNDLVFGISVCRATLAHEHTQAALRDSEMRFRTATEQELKQKNQELETRVAERARELLDLYEHAPCGYHSLAQDGTVLRVNQTELDLLGYTRDEYVGHRLTEFMTPESAVLFQHMFSEVGRVGHVRDLEFDFLCKRGRVRAGLISGELARDTDGQPGVFRSTLVDNSELKARNQKIIDLNNFLSEILKVLPFGLAVVDEQGHVTLHNSLFESSLRYPSELCRREPLRFEELIRFGHERGDYAGQSLEEVMASFSQALDKSQTVCFERQLADGGFLEICAQPISTQCILLTVRDISEQKRTEKTIEEAMHVAEGATQAKSQFLANMSHEIRTPMNAILGLTYLLEHSDLPPAELDQIRKIHSAGRSLLALINDILDFSKIEANRLEIEDAPFHLDDLFNNLATIMAANLGRKEIELIIAPPPENLGQLRGDALRLERVLINLTSNAIKFTEHGHVDVSVTVTAQSEQALTLHFSVRDTGIGITPAQQATIFNAFSQADVSTTRRFGGTGLGLTISRQLVELMGGQLALNSEPGAGSEFWFDLPFKRVEGSPLSAPAMAHLEVLIIDDNTLALEGLARTASSLGWTAHTVDSGAAAVEHLMSHPCHHPAKALFLVDWQMPGMDGFATARAIRETSQGTAYPIIIMVSAHAREELMVSPDSGMADGFLTKPITASALYDEVARAKSVGRGEVVAVQPPSTKRLAGVRMLVVDDSDINREVAQMIFAREGAEVTLACDGQQAMDWLQAHPAGVDIVLMDVHMPVMDGYVATRMMRDIPALAALPVIALTAGAFDVEKRAASEAGMSGFLAKPFDVDTAIELIRSHTGNVRAAPVGPPAPLAVQQGMAVWKDPAVYGQYLRRFAAEYADVVDRIRQAEPAAAMALAHKLMGAAATLALPAVASQAGQVDRALRAGNDARAELMTLQTTLQVARTTIEIYTGKDAEPHAGADMGPHAGAAAGTARADHAAEVLDLLTRTLAAFDHDNPAFIEPLLTELGAYLPAERLQPLHLAVEQYDFRSGEAATRALAADIRLAMET